MPIVSNIIHCDQYNAETEEIKLLRNLQHFYEKMVETPSPRHIFARKMKIPLLLLKLDKIYKQNCDKYNTRSCMTSSTALVKKLTFLSILKII
jgi:hypothetical protein